MMADIESFKKHLRYSEGILALCGAGLSASSGLPTFRGAGGLWRSYDATSLATPWAFGRDPGLVWQFYSYRRHMALQVKPNAAHYALAALSRRKKGFLTLTQNVDGKLKAQSKASWDSANSSLGLSQRAGHLSHQLHMLHGSLFDIRCTGFYCNYLEQNNFTDPIVPALAIPTSTPQAPSLGMNSSEGKMGDTSEDGTKPAFPAPETAKELDISDDRVELPELGVEDLPHCPQCREGILRPGVVWFGEPLPQKTLSEIDDFINASNKIDLILVIGTSSKVYPAAGYVETAREKGARVAVINMDRADIPGGSDGLDTGDWFFEGDAAKILPEILEDEVGDISLAMEEKE